MSMLKTTLENQLLSGIPGLSLLIMPEWELAMSYLRDSYEYSGDNMIGDEWYECVINFTLLILESEGR